MHFHAYESHLFLICFNLLYKYCIFKNNIHSIQSRQPKKKMDYKLFNFFMHSEYLNIECKCTE